jgi:hypothetical protein
MVSMLALSAIDPGFKPWLGQTNDYEIGICCFSANLPALIYIYIYKEQEQRLVGLFVAAFVGGYIVFGRYNKVNEQVSMEI